MRHLNFRLSVICRC